MSKVSVPSLMLLCAAMAACSDSTVTAPRAAASVSETPADIGFAYTIDGELEYGFATEEAMAQLAGAQMLGAQLAASAQSAGGSRSTGHVGLFTTGPATGIAAEKYSYSALQTDPATLAAKGQYEIQYTAVSGTEIKIHGEVSCMIVFGNTARATGPITKVWRNGVQIPITANTHAFWVVVDNGEGASNPDFVSLARFSNAGVARNFCVNGFGSIVYANQEGNIQVEP